MYDLLVNISVVLSSANCSSMRSNTFYASQQFLNSGFTYDARNSVITHSV